MPAGVTDHNRAVQLVLAQRQHKRLHDKAYRLLARREYSAVELRQKLEAVDDCDRASVDAVMQELSRTQAQSDQRFAAQVCRGGILRGKGPVYIKHRLRQHQIDAELIDTLMAAQAATWQPLAATVREKKFGAAPCDYKEWARQARFLQQRGFTAEQIGRFDPARATQASADQANADQGVDDPVIDDHDIDHDLIDASEV